MSRRVLARWWAIAVVGALALAVTPFALADRDDDDDDAKDKGKLAFAQRDDDDDDDDDGRKGREKANTYRVTIRNLTSGQPLSPPVVATHRGEDELFEVGELASVGVREIAENGNNAPILAFLDANPFGTISDFEASDVPLFPEETPGGAEPPNPPDFPDEVTLTLSADKHARNLSVVTMLVCTNDGFTGVNSLELPKKAGRSVTVRTNGYDAHTEVNDEDLAHIVPPCQLIGVSSGEPGMDVSNPALAEGGVIEHHEGIDGTLDDLDTGIHGWTDPVARIKVKRTG
jgi:Spondin_N